MELTAAVISAKMSDLIVRELEYKDISVFHWVDSKVVLGYINNEAKRFHVFVANRVQQIHDLSKSDTWFYIDSSANPSDDASRGISARELLYDSRWLRGPEFLWQRDQSWKSSLYKADEETENCWIEEMRKATCFVTNCNNGFVTYLEPERLERFSSWNSAIRAVANCIRYVRLIKSRVQNEYVMEKLNVEHMMQAERQVVKGLQSKYFEREIQYLKSEVVNQDDAVVNAHVKQSNLNKISSLFRLDPILDSCGILRIGGRIRLCSTICAEMKHPIIFPRKSHLTTLLIDHHHIQACHSGRGFTHNMLRQRGYWICGGSSAVSYHIMNCFQCKRLRGRTHLQKMSDLPEDRLEEAPPFTFCGLDIFGCFYIKEKRSEIKRYCVLFTCLSSRAIHIETVNSLETSAFINALRRFLCRRGPTRMIRSDCGTNIIGCRNDLNKALQEMDQETIKNYLLSEHCDWIEFKFNSPSSSHMGGVWERQIRTVRSVLEPLLWKCGSQLDDEGLRTFCCEAENVVNSRALTTDPLCDPSMPAPLTPNHLLTMKAKLLLPPPGKFQDADLYARKRWRRVQFLANEFWKRWRNEYVHTLQHRQKWTNKQRNFKTGDVVLISDESSPRNLWKLGRVSETTAGSDGLVRRVKLNVANRNLNSAGKRVSTPTVLERPIHKLVLLVPYDKDKDSRETKKME
uniref:uncharacterized protein LOC120337819 n=1 Tax=Styela clava TaxID=7725 RepID=UPI0019398E2C|nr:uncharacterized protein LOC120337819 [Styela clava]